MKNMLRSTAAWLNEKVSARKHPAPELVTSEPAPALTPVAETAVAKPAVQESVAPVLPLTAPTPAIHSEPTLSANLPKLSLHIKGTNFYATCPHCESVFNLQQRLVDPRFKRLFATQGLTCPKCEKGVAMPSPEDLRIKKN